MAADNYTNTLGYQLLFLQLDVPRDTFPNFDRFGGNEGYTGPKDKDSRKDIKEFKRCEEVPRDNWRAAEGFNDREKVVSLESFVGCEDPVHEVVSENDTAVIMNTHFLRLSHEMFARATLPDRFSQGRATWEATLLPVGRFYTEIKTGKRVQLNVRPDIAYGLKVPNTDLNFGKGMLAGFAEDLRKVAGSGSLRTLARRLPGSLVNTFAKDSTLFLKQISSYCFSFRTKYAAMSDLDYLILFRFHKMEIRPNDTPVDVWNRGHGGQFQFTVLDKSEHAFKPMCYNSFLREAALKTPRDN
ncbi:hypothetical protein CTA1_2957 [Colletotrichum tanaceti]|uniref:Uncharacterized protein n=1 Tax=Colletotrichum tanaceti TaxID=1306861 RepID=A0A4U6X8N5_9PEZI|nr:hypothetical protein CTA1_2957 [Colletotrichum tanaceti]